MSLTTDALLALKVTRWALANGWRVKDRSVSFDGYERSTTWTNGVDPVVTVWAFQHGGAILYDASDVDVDSVTQAVDALVMFTLLPVEFSSAFAAGRESAYDRDEIEWSCRIKDGRPAFASSFTEAGAHRYAATDPVHLAVFCRRVGPWVRVPEAGGRDA